MLGSVWRAVTTQLLIVVVCLVVNGLLSGSEIALISLREGQIQRIEAKGRRGRRLADLARDPTQFLTTVQIGITLANIVASASFADALATRLEGQFSVLGVAARPLALVLSFLVLTYASLVIGELVPKRVAMQRAEGWSLRAAGPLAFLATTARPAVWLLGRSTNFFVKLLGGNPDARTEDVTEAEIRDLISTQTAVDPQQKAILHGAFEVAERSLREIVTSRHQVVALQRDQPASAARKELVAGGHTRAPVFGRDIDDVVGIVHLIDLVDADDLVADHTRPPVVFPETVLVLDALQQLRGHRQQMAVVVNEHGGTEGIVTIEDLLEEIVGELYDEFDLDSAEIVADESGAVVLRGNYPVHDLPDIGIELPEGPYATVAGYALAQLGHIPEGGEVAEADGWRVEVIDVEGRAITKLRLCPLGLSPGGEDLDGS